MVIIELLLLFVCSTRLLPPINPNFSQKELVQQVYPAVGGGTIVYTLAVGTILDSLITFLVVSLVIFIIVKSATRLGIDWLM